MTGEMLPGGCSSRSAQMVIQRVRISVSSPLLGGYVSQKSSVPQVAKSVSQALIPDTPHAGICFDVFQREDLGPRDRRSAYSRATPKSSQC